MRLVAPGGEATTYDYELTFRPYTRQGVLVVLDSVEIKVSRPLRFEANRAPFDDVSSTRVEGRL